jgi:hypothetical protein
MPTNAGALEKIDLNAFTPPLPFQHVAHLGHAETHADRVVRPSAIDLRLEQPQDLIPPLTPPHCGTRHRPAILHDQRIGQGVGLYL